MASATLPASDCCSMYMCLPAFVGGVLILALAEILLLVYTIMGSERRRSGISPVSSAGIETHGGSINFRLQGNLWVAPLPEGDWGKAVLKQVTKDKKKEGGKEGQKKEGIKNSIEIAPMWRHATLQKKDLHLKAADGTEETISLEGCDVLAVSRDCGPSRKWAKKFPIKVHHDDRAIYGGCKDCLFYLQTGWEKEAWCEVLRATAKLDVPSNYWVLKTKAEYEEYTHCVEAHIPYVNMFHTGMRSHFSDGQSKEDKSDGNRVDEGFFKKRTIWKKLTRRGSKIVGSTSSKDMKSADAVDEFENFTRRISAISPGQEDASIKDGDGVLTIVPSSSGQPGDANGGSKANTIDIGGGMHNVPSKAEDEFQKAPIGAASREGKEGLPLTVAVEKTGGKSATHLEQTIDQGLLCLNMFVSRLFFDFYHSPTRMAGVQMVFQKQVSRMKTPSYIKSVTITNLDLGKSPPFATAIRMLPADTGGTLRMEVDLEWKGGAFITCETRLEVRDSGSQEKVAGQAAQPGLGGLLTGIEEDLEIAGDVEGSVSGGMAALSTSGRTGDLRGLDEGGTRKGGWVKSMRSVVSRVAEQVSQVPLVLSIRCVSLKGTGVIRMKAPPSDRIWFSFKEMPELQLVPEPCIGDRKISSGPVGAFIVHQLKMQLRESLVMPNGEDVCLNWMLSEKDNWVPQSTIPVAFSPLQASGSVQSGRSNVPRSNANGDKPQLSSPSVTLSPVTSVPPLESLAALNQLHRSASTTTISNNEPVLPQAARPPVSLPSSIAEELQADLTRPLLDKGESTERSGRESEGQGSDRVGEAFIDFMQLEDSSSENDLQYVVSEDALQALEQLTPKLTSRRSKMLNLGKKMGVKLDEKRRNVLERLRERKTEGPEGSSHSGR